MLDLAGNGPFGVTELSLAINRIPYQLGQIGRLNLFTVHYLTTTQTLVETRGTRLALVPELPRGAPPTVDVHDRRSAAALRIPHFPIRTSLYADEVQNVRAFGSTDQLVGVQSVVNDRQASLNRRLDDTMEILRLGAVKGIVITAYDRMTGVPVTQFDVFHAFDVAQQPELEWPIAGAGGGGEAAYWNGQLQSLTNELGRAMADELPGGQFTRIMGIAGKDFYDAWITHPAFLQAWRGISATPLLTGNLGTSREFGDVEIVEYRGRQPNGAYWIEPDMCYFFPVGVPDLFAEFYAPGDYMDAVNTIALPRYTQMEVKGFNKGYEMESQMNVLPLCTAPRALFRARLKPWVAGAAAPLAKSAPPSHEQSPVGSPAKVSETTRGK